METFFSEGLGSCLLDHLFGKIKYAAAHQDVDLMHKLIADIGPCHLIFSDDAEDLFGQIMLGVGEVDVKPK